MTPASPAAMHRAATPARWLAVVLVMLMAGCASTPPAPKPPPSFAQAPQAHSRFAAVEQHLAAEHGPQASGFRLLERNAEALKWRQVLIDSASHSLDLQYYVWFGDTAGQWLMSRVIAAADRGVKVRLLLDDLSSMLRNMSSPELRDALLARLDSHPHIEVRVFNAWHERGWLGRVLEGSTDFSRLNRRMHNKQMVVDNRAALIGGRNVGDEYMGLNPEFNFLDLDVLGVGPVARQASSVFDRYWNSDWVQRIPRGAPQQPETQRTLPRTPADHPAVQSLQAGAPDWAAEIASLRSGGPQFAIGRSAVHTDTPSRAEGTHNHVPEAFRALMRSARHEVLITNAYIIPDSLFMNDLRELGARGVKVRILTNSLASHDVPAVNAHYEGWRREILQAGVDLHEMKARAAVQAELVDTPPVRSGFVGLHTKAMVIDRERAFIGSMNLDPRSEIINTEMGVIIDSAPLAAAVAGGMQRVMAPDNSWQLQLVADGTLRWTSDEGERQVQPARSVWQRLQNLLFKLMPASYY